MKTFTRATTITSLLLLGLTTVCQAWVPVAPLASSLSSITRFTSTTTLTASSTALQAKESSNTDISNRNNNKESSRRKMLHASTLAAAILFMSSEQPAEAAEEELYAPKFVQEYSDFTEAPSGGWRYRDVKPGSSTGAKAKKGDRVVFDWSGYTIGYFGRPFQAKGGPVGGAFDKDLELTRTVIGSGQIIRGLEEALQDMTAGSVRQIVIPYSEALSYPPDDLTHERVGPKPSTFSGQRALNFVLENQRLDRTLLFNVKVVRVDRADGKGGFVRGDK